MQKYPSLQQSVYRPMIRAGEVGGVLEEALQRYPSSWKKNGLRRKSVALTYPVIVSSSRSSSFWASVRSSFRVH